MPEGRFVGRAGELRELAGELHAVTAHRESRVTAVTGPPGIGKTRLVAEFRGRTRRSAGWVVARASPALSAAPLAPLREAIDDVDGTANGILTRLTQLAAGRPVVLWLDDLHEADSATQHLVNRIGRVPLQAPVLLLATLRADATITSADVAASIGTLLKDGLARELRVPPLGETDILHMAELALGPAPATADLGRWLADRTRGNALMLTAVLADLGREPERRAAETVQERTRSLLSSLSPAAVVAAEVAAVLGAPFTVPELLTLEPNVGAGIDRLVATGLLIEEAGTRRLGFGHPIVQEAVYDMTGPARRAELHTRVAARLPLDSGRLAYHLARSARPGDQTAIEALLRAAADAIRAGSPSVAVAHLRDALDLVPPADETRRAAVLDQLAGAADAAGDHTAGIPALRELLNQAAGVDERVTTRLRLASFLSAGGGDLAEADGLVGEAVSLARSQAPDRLSSALTERAWLRGEAGNLEGQAAVAREALELAQAAHDPAAQLHALGPLAHSQMLLGRMAAALEASAEAVSIARSIDNAGQLAWHLSVRGEILAAAGDVDGAIALVGPLASSGRSQTDVVDSNLVFLLWLAGQWTDALESARRLLAAAPPQVPVRTAWALAVAAAIEAAAGRPEAARPLLALAERTYGGRAFYSFSALHDWSAGMAAWALGDLVAGVDRLQRSVAWLERMNASGMLSLVLPYLCAVACDAGAMDIAAAAKARAQLLDQGPSTVARVAARACAALLGADSMGEAAAEADRTGLRLLAATLLSRGDIDQMAEAAGRFAAMPAPALEARCREALRAAGSRGRRAALKAGSLTRREAEVAGLARRGLATAAIASRLGIGERTVETHLSRAYAKLGVSGRRELATSSPGDSR